MKTCIALFRGINVGGSGALPMKELIVLLQGLGLKNVKTYIQSGNAVFSCPPELFPGIAGRISSGIKDRFGFEPGLFLLDLAGLEQAIAENPFPESEAIPESLHLGFLASKPQKPDLEGLESMKKESERFRLKGKIFYLSAPEGVGKSRLAAKAERLLGVPMTDRNWRTVCKLRDMAREAAG
jgi:uncharacterized protein (DUF1697 family)